MTSKDNVFAMTLQTAGGTLILISVNLKGRSKILKRKKRGFAQTR